MEADGGKWVGFCTEKQEFNARARAAGKDSPFFNSCCKAFRKGSGSRQRISAVSFREETLKKETDADFVIIAMSGNFVQRGAPALMEKYSRARMALSCGADLVGGGGQDQFGR